MSQFYTIFGKREAGKITLQVYTERHAADVQGMARHNAEARGDDKACTVHATSAAEAVERYLAAFPWEGDRA